MRLINTSTLLLDEFFGDEIPKYAILSHTWTNKQEVTLREWMEPTATAISKAGFVKVRDACAVALALGHEWLWADTVCIDKTSSAELSEAINSMFAWYRDSAECLVYLTDVEQQAGTDDQMLEITASRWFTRGWTLQELLAPDDLTFYDRRWRRLGTKSEYADAIALVTGIPAYILGSRGSLPSVLRQSVAERMSWMARRRTTRVEDMAYCMLGIFDINMPLLYGEGTKAFQRLQYEIVRAYHDHTIFAWTWTPDGESGDVRERDAGDIGVLAPSPAAFAGQGSVLQALDWQLRHDLNFDRLSPYSITNLGLSIRLPTRWMARKQMIVLNARSGSARNPSCHYLAISLKGSFIEWTLARSAYPNSAFRFCTSLPTPRPMDLFLAPRVDGHRFLDGPRRRLAESRLANPELYGLVLTFGRPYPGLGSHPVACLDVEESLVTFPPQSTAWKEISSAAGEPRVHIRSTAVVLCVSNNPDHDCEMVLETEAYYDEPRSLLFTLSIVTAQGPEGTSKSIAVFGNGVQIPGEWHPERRDQWECDSEGGIQSLDDREALAHDKWLDEDPRLGREIDKEMNRVLNRAKEGLGDLEQCFKHWNLLEANGAHNIVQVGRCDVGYPGFKEARMVLINLPGSPE